MESRGSDAQPSSSNMISLEFVRDSPPGSLGPGSVDDDEYVEYSLDMLADFPTNVEEEERVNCSNVLRFDSFFRVNYRFYPYFSCFYKKCHDFCTVISTQSFQFFVSYLSPELTFSSRIMAFERGTLMGMEKSLILAVENSSSDRFEKKSKGLGTELLLLQRSLHQSRQKKHQKSG